MQACCCQSQARNVFVRIVLASLGVRPLHTLTFMNLADIVNRAAYAPKRSGADLGPKRSECPISESNYRRLAWSGPPAGCAARQSPSSLLRYDRVAWHVGPGVDQRFRSLRPECGRSLNTVCVWSPARLSDLGEVLHGQEVLRRHQNRNVAFHSHCLTAWASASLSCFSAVPQAATSSSLRQHLAE